MMKLIFWLIAIGVFCIFWIRYAERHNTFFPMKEIELDPSLTGIAYKEVYLTTSDNVRLHGWFFPNKTAKHTLLFFHGNAGNISHRLDKALLLHSLGLNVFLFDYRGYGKSDGTPSEAGVYRDASAAYNYLVKHLGVPENAIILYGESLGGAIAIDVAKKQNPAALITEEAFSSLRDMGKVVYPFIPSSSISNKFDSVSKISSVRCPKLIIHSINDEIVPFGQSVKLYNAASKPKEMLEIRGTHNTAFQDSIEHYRHGIDNFIEALNQKSVQ